MEDTTYLMNITDRILLALKHPVKEEEKEEEEEEEEEEHLATILSR